MVATLEELQSLLPSSASIPVGEPIIPEIGDVSSVPGPHTFSPSTATPTPIEAPAPVPSTPLSIPSPSPSAQISLPELQAMLPEKSFEDRAKTKAGELTSDALSSIYDRITGTDVSDPQALERLVTTLFGSMVGAQLGAKTPGPPIAKGAGILGGAIAGVALGTAVPEVILRGLEEIGIIPEGQADKVVLSWEELRTVLKGEILLETATLGGAGLLRTGGRLTGQLFTGMTREGRRLAELAAKYGIDLLPVQVGDRRIGKGFVAVLGRFPFVSRPFTIRGTATEKAFERRVVDMPELIAPIFRDNDLSIKIYEDAKTLLKGFNDNFRNKYKLLWEDAERMGVGVRPEHTLSEAKAIREEILKKTTTGVDEALGLKKKEVSGIHKKFLDYMDEHIFKMEKFTPGEDISYIRREQTLREMDGLASVIDNFRLELEPGQAKPVQNYLRRIKFAILQDMKSNTFGQGAEEIAARVREIDKSFSFVMETFFETATAKKFGAFHKRGLRAIEFDKATRRNIDELAKAVINVNSPIAMAELRRLVEPSTFRSIKAAILYDALRGPTSRSRTGEHLIFDAHDFERRIGFQSKRDPKRATFEYLFKTGNVTIKDIENFMEIGKKISGLEIPNVSAFIARRATLGGRAAVWSAFTVGATGSAASGYDSGGFLGLAANTLLFIGGTRLLSATLANPRTARAFLRIADKEASTAAKRAAIVRIVRLGVERIGADSLIEGGIETYDKIYPGEGNIDELFLPGPGITEEQKQSGALRQEKLKIAEILAYASGYVSLGLGTTPPEPSELSNSLLPTFHKGGLITKDAGLKQLAEKYDTIPDLQRDKQLRQLHHYDNNTFNQLLDYLENR